MVVAFGALPTAAQALLVVVGILVEAVVLYVGYGYLEDQFAPAVIETIQSI
jgi:hypothetical protein